ncbi:hypothetical protein C8J57DRAFT_1478523 [Mycena rebaudengoi]|nr:hypothetical protein C8J57DRAFT_1478523 [Mycena rebaudengoi]
MVKGEEERQALYAKGRTIAVFYRIRKVLEAECSTSVAREGNRARSPPWSRARVGCDVQGGETTGVFVVTALRALWASFPGHLPTVEVIYGYFTSLQRASNALTKQCSKVLKLWFLITIVTGTIIGQCSEGGSGRKDHYTVTDRFSERRRISVLFRVMAVLCCSWRTEGEMGSFCRDSISRKKLSPQMLWSICGLPHIDHCSIVSWVLKFGVK